MPIFDKTKGDNDFGIVANVVEIDRVFRLGAKLTIIRLNPGGGNDRLFVSGMSRGGFYIEKYIPIWRLDKFRAKWLKPKLKMKTAVFSSKETMSAKAAELSIIADRFRKERPNRLFKKPKNRKD